MSIKKGNTRVTITLDENELEMLNALVNKNHRLLHKETKSEFVSNLIRQEFKNYTERMRNKK